MRIRTIFIGHNSPEFLEQQRVFRQSLAAPETKIETVSVKGGPETIEQDYDEIRSCPFILDEVLRAEEEQADAVIIDCTLDPVAFASADPGVEAESASLRLLRSNREL